jgi:hypothetical protein
MRWHADCRELVCPYNEPALELTLGRRCCPQIRSRPELGRAGALLVASSAFPAKEAPRRMRTLEQSGFKTKVEPV